MARGYGADDLYRLLKAVDSGKEDENSDYDKGIDTVTKALEKLYDSFMRAGFTDDQSTLFINTVVRAMAEGVVRKSFDDNEKKGDS